MMKLNFRRPTWIAIAGIAVLIAGAMVLNSIMNTMNAPHADFDYYAPAHLPAGFSIKDKRIDATHEDASNHMVNGYDLNLRTEDWVYSIRESKDFADSRAETTTGQTSYDPHSIAVTCKQRTSPQRITYRLCHWADYGRISVYEVQFTKGGTFIGTTFPTTLDHVVAEAELDTYVDSFHKGSTDGWKVLTGSIF